MISSLALLTLSFGCGDHEDSGDGGHHADGGATDGGGMDGGAVDTGELDFSRTMMTDGGTWTVTYAPTPDPIPFNTEFTLGFAVDPATSVTLSNATATMPNHMHGMTVTPVTTDNGDGTGSSSPFLFHMEGWWEITVDVSDGTTTETAAFNVWCCD